MIKTTYIKNILMKKNKYKNKKLITYSFLTESNRAFKNIKLMNL